ncbi:MAG: DEAD/DEAH box helicase family protein [candidate division Zixibacteria bacterium]|nr:DEAD/DEAH box helicase family protein [candidate division Zixibacteria bacterium]
MADELIENPILNSPYSEPNRHFKFGDEGITNEIIESRRVSAYFIPIPRPKKKSAQIEFETQWTQDRIKEIDHVNRIRQRVNAWRKGNYSGITHVTRRLLQYWTNPDRGRKLFFCQIEALETLIYLLEVANRYGDGWIENDLRQANDLSNPGLNRIACKMATGSGKTVVMAMIIAWQALNKIENAQDARFSDTFLIVSPGITIRDRLRVLLPNDPHNYYDERDILPGEFKGYLGKARIFITNFHTLKLREKVSAPKLTKKILSENGQDAFLESPDEMVRRVCKSLGNKKNIVIINDEAHHCYRHHPEIDEEVEILTGDEKQEAKKREEAARVWISGIEAIKAKIGVRAIYDLSATPFFLRGSGYPEGTLFGWVVSDFSLIDAIESGIVKIPRVPVSDNAMTGKMPTYRDLWIRIREDLPRKGRRTGPVGGEPKLPLELEAALHSLYENYRQYHERWESNLQAIQQGQTPPVFIVVCNNTNVSKMVYDYVSGWEKKLPDGSSVLVPGNLPLFSNVENGLWTARTKTILVDSEQLESGEAMSDDFKRIAAVEIEEFKAEYRQRFPGRDTEKLTDEDILREVMNTVGKQGKLGEQIKCVVSVSMLTEGWDANTVTHILGVRAFGTQLLCEQVVGRGLRRTSYAVDDDGRFAPEYAEVYGVPFSFIPCSGSIRIVTPGPIPTHIRALDDRREREIRFPRIIGYKFDFSGERLNAAFTEESKLTLSTRDVPTKTISEDIIGDQSIHTLDDLKNRRENEVAFLLAKHILAKYFRDDDGNDRPWLFPQLLEIAKGWMADYVVCQDDTFPQLLLLQRHAHDAADKIYRAIPPATPGATTLKPILKPYETWGSTNFVSFDTTKNTYPTQADKCHISHVVADTDSWEQKMAQSLEDMDEVYSYVKNQNLGFAIPYTIDGEEHSYIPDFIARMDDGHGPDDLLNVIIEVTGEARRDKLAKVETARKLWIPAVNNHGSLGRWTFIEVGDPWNGKNAIRSRLSHATAGREAKL